MHQAGEPSAALQLQLFTAIRIVSSVFELCVLDFQSLGYIFARFWAAQAGSCSRILAAPFASNKRLLVSPVSQKSMQCFVAHVFAPNDRNALLCYSSVS